jgi:hypothetical protein
MKENIEIKDVPVTELNVGRRYKFYFVKHARNSEEEGRLVNIFPNYCTITQIYGEKNQNMILSFPKNWIKKITTYDFPTLPVEINDIILDL